MFEQFGQPMCEPSFFALVFFVTNIVGFPFVGFIKLTLSR
jgi:hypothetical protein